MSIAPPGYPTDETGPGSGSRKADDPAQYEFKSVQALRGREDKAKAKWHDQGWEFVSENRGTVRTELSFRRVKPKTLGSHLLSIAAGFRRPQPKTQSVVVASCALLLVAGIIGFVVGSQGEADAPKPSAAQTTASSAAPNTVSAPAPAAATITDITVDELVDKLNAGGIKVGDQFRLTGELVGSDQWMIGASGDFFVMLKTKEGADLEVFIDQSDANGWQDGMKVEMVVKMVERTIGGETTDGFFEAESAKTISVGTAGNDAGSAVEPVDHSDSDSRSGVQGNKHASADDTAGDTHAEDRPNAPYDLNCSDFDGPVRVSPGDPHGLDRDGDGIGCDT